jgi:thiamine transport system ATP-binding protein
MSPEMSPKAQASAAPAVRGQNIKVTYGKRTVLDVEHVSLAQGETYALLGASGAGKSTLLKVLGLLEKPTSGQVFHAEKQVGGRDLAARRTIAAVFQKPYLLRGSVADNVGYGLRLRRLPTAERNSRIAEALERVGLSGWEPRSALMLSGGEAQRVALARALVLRPQLMLLDEPLSYLDPLLKRQLTLEFAEILANEEVTALYVTHDRDEAAVVADRIGVMRDGRIIAEGDPESVIALPADPWVASFLETEMPFPGVVREWVNGTSTIDCGGTTVIAESHPEVGSRVLVGIRPADVILIDPGMMAPASDASNRIRCSVVDVMSSGASSRVVVEANGVRLAAAVSPASVDSMRLAPGNSVEVVFRPDAVRLRAED